MVVLGPSVIRNGLSPETAIFGSGDMAVLGPALGQASGLDPISRIFLLVGKILAVRRVIKDEAGVQPNLINRFKAGHVALIDQVVDGSSDETDLYQVLWETIGNQLQYLDVELNSMTGSADDAARGVVHRESALILGLDPLMPLPKRVDAVIEYMRERDLNLADADYGLRDYLMAVLRDSEGIPAAFPASSEVVDFPDSWITPVPIQPSAGGTRSWTILW
jgi:hypothetical protein